MSGSVKKKAVAKPLAVADVSRKPQQGRSLASLKRMIAAARELMLELGNEDFTLAEVSERGQVSIGSIYLRFESKDNLVRGVIAEELDALAKEETELVQRLKDDSTDLANFMYEYVEGYAEVLRKHAPLLRLTMERAEYDPLVATPGKQHLCALKKTQLTPCLHIPTNLAAMIRPITRSRRNPAITSFFQPLRADSVWAPAARPSMLMTGNA